MDLKCCHNCKKDAAECDVWHDCGKDCPKWEAQIQTNADRIRAMSDEELCKLLGEYKFFDICQEGCNSCTHNGDCDKRLLEWLKQPAEVEHE
jgi:hypothetical protein